MLELAHILLDNVDPATGIAVCIRLRQTDTNFKNALQDRWTSWETRYFQHENAINDKSKQFYVREDLLRQIWGN